MNAPMRAESGTRAGSERPIPQIKAPTDAIVRIVRIIRTTHRGTDLHILECDAPACGRERIRGREGVGIVEKVGAAVTAFHPGDHVIVAGVSPCGTCEDCRKGLYSHCVELGGIVEGAIGGARPEFVRTAFADTNLHRVPAGSDEEAMVICALV